MTKTETTKGGKRSTFQGQDCRLFEAELGTAADGGPYQVTFTLPIPITGEVWVTWWETRDEILGGNNQKMASPGSMLKARYLAFLAIILSGNYAGPDQVEHQLKETGMQAPASVIQWINQTADAVLAEVWEVPKP